jgi:hypothetical protein
MSAGGQRGIDVSGVRPMRLQNASDFTERRRVQLVYQTFASTTGANAYNNQTPDSTGYYLDFIKGIKESCSNCTGLPYQYRVNMNFRS